MRLRKILVLSILIPFVLFAQAQGQAITKLDSMVNQATQMPDNKVTKGTLLSDIATTYREQNDLNSAADYYSKALKVFEGLNNKNGIARTDGNLGSTYLGMAISGQGESKSVNLHKAVTYLNKSVSLANENGYADVMDVFSKDLAEAMRMLQHEMPAAAQNNGEEGNVKIANTGAANDDSATTAGPAGNSKERWYYIGGITLLALVLVIVVLTMYWTYKKQKGINEIFAKEKKKSEDLLLNILPEQVAKELKDKGMVHPQQYDNVSVIMTDFAGFTTVAERFSAKQLVGELHACFKAFDGMLDKYNVEKIKTVGDAYLAIAGVPTADPNHAVNMVSLALVMRDFMLYRKTQLGDATFDMRIGVHTGTVVAGIVGAKKFAYDIWGDTVNLAARMEQGSVPGKVNISQSTYELVKDKFHCEYRGEIDAKNKGKLKMYYVLDRIR